MRSLFRKRSRTNRVIFILWLMLIMIGESGPGTWQSGFLNAQAQANPAILVKGETRVTIWVYNYANLGKKTLAQAEEDMSRIVGKAGVSIEWIECPSSEEQMRENRKCQESWTPLRFALVVHPEYVDHTGRKSRPNPLGSTNLFDGGRDSHYIYVFYDVMAQTHRHLGVPLQRTLSIAAAHELGHILLHSNTHSSSGLMQAQLKQKDWDDASMGRLLFTSQQAEIIRSEVLTRRNLLAVQAAQESIPSLNAQANPLVNTLLEVSQTNKK